MASRRRPGPRSRRDAPTPPLPDRVRGGNITPWGPFCHLHWCRSTSMSDHVYKVVELVGSSEESVSKAIDRAIAKAALSLRNLGWFEVEQVRGHIENGKVAHYQVTLKVGFTVDD